METTLDTVRSEPATRREPRRSGQTAADVIHAKLRDDILTLRRLPGSPVFEKDVGEEFGVSRTPVREALLRLADERLIEITPKSGIFVSRIPVDILADAFAAREALELMLVEKATRHARPSQITAMHAIIQLQHEYIESNDAAGFHESDEALHRTIAETAGHAGVWGMILQIKVQLDRLRRLTLPRLGRIEYVVHEHERIVEGIASGEPTRAIGAMREHIGSLRVVLGEIRNLNPDYFDGTPNWNEP
jgi:DNA-binding GntR family transcriptional regulator